MTAVPAAAPSWAAEAARKLATAQRSWKPSVVAVSYRIGSITKTFTAVLALQLRDAGLLDLDDPLGKHLPGGWRAVRGREQGERLQVVREGGAATRLLFAGYAYTRDPRTFSELTAPMSLS